MKTLYAVLFLLFISVISFNCQKEISHYNNGNPGGNPDQQDPLTGTVQGIIEDEQGQPAAGVSVKAGNKVGITDNRGYFRITDATLDKKASMISAEKAGYFKAFRVFQATSGVNHVKIKLIQKELSGSVSSSAGGAVTLPNGAKIQLPANGVVKAAGGGAYSGDIEIFASYIDPTADDISGTVPGSFMAIDKNNKRVNLASYGMLVVELESISGERLQVANDHKATLTTPIPASLMSSAPASISLWYVDEQSGIWKEEGNAVKNGNVYVGEVKHFSYWNCDVSVPTVPFSVKLKTAEGEPLVYEQVRIRGANEFVGMAYGHADSLGQVSGFIPANMNLVMEIMNTCGEIVYTKNIGPFSSAADLGTITLPGSAPHMIYLEGTLVNCSNAPVTDGYVLIYYENVRRYVEVSANGHFSLGFTRCTSTSPELQVFGVDNSTQQQSATSTFTITNPETQLGEIKACGISADEFINYTLDGTNYSIVPSIGDSLLSAYTSQISTAPVKWLTGIFGQHLLGQVMEFEFKSDNQSAGVYALDFLRVRDFRNTQLVAPFNVTITSFATAPGEYFEGNLSGEFKDSGNPAITHTVVSNFRIRRL